jgi:glutaredoxin
MKLTLFSQWECKTCLVMKETLEKEEMKYKVIEVLEHKELWEGIRKQQLQLDPTGIMYTPTVLVESKGIGVYISAGRDFDTVEEALDKIREYL